MTVRLTLKTIAHQKTTHSTTQLTAKLATFAFVVSLASCSSQGPVARALNGTGGGSATAQNPSPSPSPSPTSPSPTTPSPSPGPTTPSPSGTPPTCESQWTTAVSQQTNGVFGYTSSVTLQAPLPPSTISRTETVTSATTTNIAKSVVFAAITDPLLKAAGLTSISNQTYTVTHDQFVSACNSNGGLAVPTAGLLGSGSSSTMTVGTQSDGGTIQIAGTSVAVKNVPITVTNVQLGAYTINANIVAAVSASYPGLPLSQTITITQSSQPLLTNKVITDQLTSGLPKTSP